MSSTTNNQLKESKKNQAIKVNNPAITTIQEYTQQLSQASEYKDDQFNDKYKLRLADFVRVQLHEYGLSHTEQGRELLLKLMSYLPKILIKQIRPIFRILELKLEKGYSNFGLELYIQLANSLSNVQFCQDFNSIFLFVQKQLKQILLYKNIEQLHQVTNILNRIPLIFTQPTISQLHPDLIKFLKSVEYSNNQQIFTEQLFKVILEVGLQHLIINTMKQLFESLFYTNIQLESNKNLINYKQLVYKQSLDLAKIYKDDEEKVRYLVELQIILREQLGISSEVDKFYIGFTSSNEQAQNILSQTNNPQEQLNKAKKKKSTKNLLIYQNNYEVEDKFVAFDPVEEEIKQLKKVNQQVKPQLYTKKHSYQQFSQILQTSINDGQQNQLKRNIGSFSDIAKCFLDDANLIQSLGQPKPQKRKYTVPVFDIEDDFEIDYNDKMTFDQTNNQKLILFLNSMCSKENYNYQQINMEHGRDFLSISQFIQTIPIMSLNDKQMEIFISFTINYFINNQELYLDYLQQLQDNNYILNQTHLVLFNRLLTQLSRKLAKCEDPSISELCHSVNKIYKQFLQNTIE